MIATTKELQFGKILEAGQYLTSLSPEALLHGTLSEEALDCIRLVYHNDSFELDPHFKTQIETNSRIKAGVAEFLSRFGAIGIRHEMAEAEAIIAAADPRQAYRDFQYYDAYLETVKMEVEGAGLKPGSRLLFLGSGPLPMTLVQFFELYGVRGTGIELLPEAAAVSRRFIQALGQEDAITIVTGDHYSIRPSEQYDHIIVALDAEPKEAIFAHLRTVLQPGTTVSYRFYQEPAGRESLRSLMLEDKNYYQHFDGFSEVKRVYATPPAVNCTAFLVRRSDS